VSRYRRWNELLELLAAAGQLQVEDAAKALNVSAATVRRDFDELASQQMLTRIRGGAVAQAVNYDLPLRYKTERHPSEKQRIGALAASMVRAGQVAGLNGGTTTTEVARALRSFPGVEGAIVYGVRVPDREGRAGAATLVCPGWIDVSALHDHLTKRLPGYARPLFVRVHRAGTEAARKLKKADLAADGFDPARTSDQLYFNDTQKNSFVPIDAGLYARIMEGEARV